MNGDALVDAVEFVLKECARFQRRFREGITSDLKERIGFTIPAPNGFGELVCGRAAAEKIDELAEEARRRSKLANRSSIETFRTPLNRLLSDQFLKKKRPLNKHEAQRLLSLASKEVLKNLKTQHHFIPCHLFNSDDPTSIQIGPVLFHNRSSFRAKLSKPARALILKSNGKERALNRYLLRSALDYYKKFKWISEIKIDNCDNSTANSLAHLSTNAAIDCLHLIFGSFYTRKMRAGGPALSTDRRARLALEPSGHLYVSNSVTWSGQVGHKKEWSRILQKDNVIEFIRLFGIAIETSVNPDLIRPLSRRILDAAQWYGEACREESHPTATIKYATALERLTVTGKSSNISDTVSSRTAALCACLDDQIDISTLKTRAKQLYDLRSKLVHGSISPNHPDAALGATLGSDLVARAILSALWGIGEAGLRADSVSHKRLSDWYDDLVTRRSG